MAGVRDSSGVCDDLVSKERESDDIGEGRTQQDVSCVVLSGQV